MLMKSENVQNGLMSLKQLLELVSAITKAIPTDMSIGVAQGIIGNPNLKKIMRAALMPPMDEEIVLAIAQWQTFYSEKFGMRLEFTGIKIPKKPEGDWRLLLVVVDLIEQLYKKCKELFSCFIDPSIKLGDVFEETCCNSNEIVYAVWVKDVQEADEDLQNLSAADITSKGILTENLSERLLHELKYFEETGKHLDEENVTICTSPKLSDGNVMTVAWDLNTLRIETIPFKMASDIMRARQVVAC